MVKQKKTHQQHTWRNKGKKTLRIEKAETQENMYRQYNEFSTGIGILEEKKKTQIKIRLSLKGLLQSSARNNNMKILYIVTEK